MIIEIHGKAGEGKTTLALALRDFLKSKGFDNVSVTDPDCVYEGQSDRRELQELRLEALAKKGTIIHVCTRQEKDF